MKKITIIKLILTIFLISVVGMNAEHASTAFAHDSITLFNHGMG